MREGAFMNMKKDGDFQGIRSITRSMRGMLDFYRTTRKQEPVEIQLHQVMYDSWRAELLVIGKIWPGDPFTLFDGIRVRVVAGVETCRLK